MYRTSNPAIRSLHNYSDATAAERATYKGVAGKSLYFIGVTLVAAIVTCALLWTNSGIAAILLGVSVPATLISALVACFAPSTVKVSGSVYAFFEGVMIGAVSMILELAYKGLVLSALLSTATVFGVMMFLYAFNIVKVTQKFKSFMYSALLAILLFNLLVFVISLFSDSVATLFYGSGPWSVLISVGMIIFAALFILVDLSNISMIVDNGMDKRYEWNGAFGLVVTVIWLYMEFLRLFAKLADRR